MSTLVIVFGRALIGLAAIVLMTRLFGLRSFSKMSSFDCAVTVAFGSVLAAMVTAPDSSVWPYLCAIAALFTVQGLVALARVWWGPVEGLLDNSPLLVMENGVPLDANLAKARMTRGDLDGKLREANAFDLSKVRAVVVEATGDVSVLHGDGELSEAVLSGVRR